MTVRKTDWSMLQAVFLTYANARATSDQIRSLFEELDAVLTAFFRSRTGKSLDAHDLTQATLLKIHFARYRFVADGSLKTWIFTIAHRTLIDHWRSRPKWELEELQDEDAQRDAAQSPSQNAESMLELSEELQTAMQTLRPIDRSIVYLYGVLGMSPAETAAVVNLSESAVKNRASRSFAKLRGLLIPVGMIVNAILR